MTVARDSADWDALARYLTGESSPDEIREIEARLSANPADRELIDALNSLTKGMAASVPAGLDIESALRTVKTRFDEPVVIPIDRARKARWMVPFPAIAAAALLAIGVAGYLAVRSRNHTTVQQAAAPSAQMVATGVGAIDSLRLPDGTIAVIGPMSSIKLASGYGTGRREVEVRGDVYLDVVHDASKPFTAFAEGAKIQDIGTKFVIHTDAAKRVVVSVTEGSVSLQGVNAGRGPAVVLKPGERGVLPPDGRASMERATPEDLSWMRRQLVFRETPLSEVAASLHRWYGIELDVRDPLLASRHLTATFSGEPPERVLEVIRLVLGADIERRGDTAIVKARR
jgi:transmembrane sensor